MIQEVDDWQYNTWRAPRTQDRRKLNESHKKTEILLSSWENLGVFVKLNMVRDADTICQMINITNSHDASNWCKDKHMVHHD